MRTDGSGRMGAPGPNPRLREGATVAAFRIGLLLALLTGPAGVLSGQAASTDWSIDSVRSRLVVNVLPAGLLASALHTHHFQPEVWGGEIALDPDHPGSMRVDVRIAADSLRDHLRDGALDGLGPGQDHGRDLGGRVAACRERFRPVLIPGHAGYGQAVGVDRATRASTTVNPFSCTMTGLKSISSISPCLATRSETWTRSRASAATSAGLPPRTPGATSLPGSRRSSPPRPSPRTERSGRRRRGGPRPGSRPCRTSRHGRTEDRESPRR